MKKRFCKPLIITTVEDTVDIVRGNDIVTVYSEEEAWKILEALNRVYDMFTEVEQ